MIFLRQYKICLLKFQSFTFRLTETLTIMPFIDLHILRGDFAAFRKSKDLEIVDIPSTKTMSHDDDGVTEIEIWRNVLYVVV